uniref:Uncharacterized protein n=1 Tax=Zea mays TaxID=4577 RepID=B4FCZ1_MAIZE|nr:unknown [Zea mays]
MGEQTHSQTLSSTPPVSASASASADLGVRKGVQMLYALQDVPRPSQMDRLCERWRPYRSVGAWYMWRLIESKVPQPAPPIPALPSPDGQIMLQQQQQQSVIQMIIPF